MSKLYTRKQVRDALCEGCKLGLSDHYGDRRTGGEMEFYHTVNGQEITCAADQWRKAANRLEGEAEG